jgi:uncharacterized protein (UPF0333 family)
MKKTSQHGIAHLGLVLLLLVAAVIAFAGYKVAKNNSDDKVNTTASSAAGTSAQVIRTKADLDNAAATLNNTNIDSDVNPDSLNSDVNSLL